MDFYLLYLLNGVLFVRPSEIVEALSTIPVYNIVISTCIAIKYPTILGQLSGQSLRERPLTACVVGMWFAVILSHLSHLTVYYARIQGPEFAKVIVYYLLLVGVVDTTERLKRFLTSLVVFGVILSVIALLNYHGYIYLPSLAAVADSEIDAASGEEYTLMRLCSTGIFNDPNDLAIMLVVCMLICVYRIVSPAADLWRFVWVAPLGLFGHGLAMTHSRGGFLTLLAGLLVLFQARFGWRKALPMALIVVPAMVLLFAGRQTDISASEDTGQGRVQIWSMAMAQLPQAPVFGIGTGQLEDAILHAAHNSFLHAYVETGIFGGTLFFGAYWISLTSLGRLGGRRSGLVDPGLRALQPILMSILAGSFVGMMTLSRNYEVPTFMLFGLAAVFLRLAGEQGGASVPRLDAWLVTRTSVASLVFLAFLYAYTRVFVRWV